ncbi:hypothetical protein AVEN_207867-1 [Araneus ventricosus]|uniref:Uncharacterized protein n=1 Tax=Araneus ventricosus TaxID=182803 RepID=A0A4Y2KRR8_ARAVE|nr:hypothetical protein AVEN_207867-1 [Araneus ventricosus]
MLRHHRATRHCRQIFRLFLFELVIVGCSLSENGTFGRPEAMPRDKGVLPLKPGHMVTLGMRDFFPFSRSSLVHLKTPGLVEEPNWRNVGLRKDHCKVAITRRAIVRYYHEREHNATQQTRGSGLS